MTPRERAAAEPSDAAMMVAYVHLGGDPEIPGGPQRTVAVIRLAHTLDAFATEHVRELLADDDLVELKREVIHKIGVPDDALAASIVQVILAALRRKAGGE
jgi:hypothetical protein